MQNNIVDVLKKDHRTVEGFFKDIKKTDSLAEKKGILGELIGEFEAHASGEEQVVYPVMEKTEGLKQDAKHSLKEHEEARKLIQEITSINAEDQKWESTLRKLNKAIDHHVKEEEEEIFPKFKDHFTKEMLEEMAVKFQAAKEPLAKAS